MGYTQAREADDPTLGCSDEEVYLISRIACTGHPLQLLRQTTIDGLTYGKVEQSLLRRKESRVLPI